MALTGEAKKDYQHGYMAEYMRDYRKRVKTRVKTCDEAAGETVKTQSTLKRPANVSDSQWAMIKFRSSQVEST